MKLFIFSFFILAVANTAFSYSEDILENCVAIKAEEAIGLETEMPLRINDENVMTIKGKKTNYECDEDQCTQLDPNTYASCRFNQFQIGSGKLFAASPSRDSGVQVGYCRLDLNLKTGEGSVLISKMEWKWLPFKGDYLGRSNEILEVVCK